MAKQRRRAQLDDEQLDELRALVRGRPSSKVAAWAALIAAVAALWSAVSVTALAVFDRVVGFLTHAP